MRPLLVDQFNRPVLKASGGYEGAMMLAEDVSEELVQFGRGGKGPLLKGPGLGVKVREDVLKTYADPIIHCH